MNSSANLISLSDSGVGPSLSTTTDYGATGGGPCNTSLSAMDCSGTGLLVDLTDAVQGPVPQALMTLAEVDDTYGIFNRGLTFDRLNALTESDASELVRSFTCGTKSEEVECGVCGDDVDTKTKLAQDEVETVTGSGENNDSNACNSSEQPTVIEPEEGAEAGLNELNSASILGGKSFTSEGVSINSAGSDHSELMDINNLSSFSIPDGDVIDDNEYLQAIKNECQSDPTVSTAIVDQIKLDLLTIEDPNPNENAKGGTDVTRPSISTTVGGTTRFSTASNVSTSTRLSTISTKDGDADAEFTHPHNNKFRLSDILSSPIRASYPVSKYYMPTPKSQTPNGGRRDRLSESLYSPNTSRIVMTGDLRRSPSTRAPVRKSISAETLHFEHSPTREKSRLEVKFSTPCASRNRHSISSQSSNGLADHRSMVGGRGGATFLNNHPRVLASDVAQGSDVFNAPRLGRLSYASTGSATSIHTLSPTGSMGSVCKMDLAQVVRELKEKREKEIFVLPSRLKLPVEQGPSYAAVQPMRATAVIQPSISKPVPESIQSHPPRMLNRSINSSTGSSSQQRKFVSPVTASSPKIAPSPSRAISNTTPTRSRYSMNVRSSGYGPQQNLNSSFASKPPLQSPNPKISVTAAIKPAAIPKSLKSGLAMPAKPASNVAKPQSIPKISKPPTTGLSALRRPTSGIASNKENSARATTSKIGLSRPRP